MSSEKTIDDLYDLLSRSFERFFEFQNQTMQFQNQALQSLSRLETSTNQQNSSKATTVPPTEPTSLTLKPVEEEAISDTTRNDTNTATRYPSTAANNSTNSLLSIYPQVINEVNQLLSDKSSDPLPPSTDQEPSVINSSPQQISNNPEDMIVDSLSLPPARVCCSTEYNDPRDMIVDISSTPPATLSPCSTKDNEPKYIVVDCLSLEGTSNMSTENIESNDNESEHITTSANNEQTTSSNDTIQPASGPLENSDQQSEDLHQDTNDLSNHSVSHNHEDTHFPPTPECNSTTQSATTTSNDPIKSENYDAAKQKDTTTATTDDQREGISPPATTTRATNLGQTDILTNPLGTGLKSRMSNLANIVAALLRQQQTEEGKEVTILMVKDKLVLLVELAQTICATLIENICKRGNIPIEEAVKKKLFSEIKEMQREYVLQIERRALEECGLDIKRYAPYYGALLLVELACTELNSVEKLQNHLNKIKNKEEKSSNNGGGGGNEVESSQPMGDPNKTTTMKDDASSLNKDSRSRNKKAAVNKATSSSNTSRVAAPSSMLNAAADCKNSISSASSLANNSKRNSPQKSSNILSQFAKDVTNIHNPDHASSPTTASALTRSIEREKTAPQLIESSSSVNDVPATHTTTTSSATGSSSSSVSTTASSLAKNPTKRVPMVITMCDSSSDDDSEYEGSSASFFGDSRKRANSDTSIESSRSKKKGKWT